MKKFKEPDWKMMRTINQACEQILEIDPGLGDGVVKVLVMLSKNGKNSDQWPVDGGQSTPPNRIQNTKRATRVLPLRTSKSLCL